MDGNKWTNGDLLKDQVTGLEGVVMVVAFYSTGCTHYGLQSKKLQDGLPQKWEWVDQSRLVLVKRGDIKFHIEETRPSGPFPSGPER